MTFSHYTNSLSAHQLPLDDELLQLIGADNFRYVYTNERLQGGAQEVAFEKPWIIDASRTDVSLSLEACDVLLVGGLRPIDLMERRLAQGKITLYMSERWFKPISMMKARWLIPGWARLFVPRYWQMAKRFVRLFDSPNYRYLPIGPHAARDMRLLLSIFHPFEVKRNRQIASSFIPWADYVDPSTVASTKSRPRASRPSLLWLGRMLDWKRVDTVIKAVRRLGDKVQLTIVGNGPERDALATRIQGMSNVELRPAVHLTEVRELMRQHDLLILSSNAQEGWGCVVNEALTEGVPVIGTYEAGASAAILPKEQLFHCGDYRELARKIQWLIEKGPVLASLPYEYTPQGGAEKLMKLIDDVRK